MPETLTAKKTRPDFMKIIIIAVLAAVILSAATAQAIVGRTATVNLAFVVQDKQDTLESSINYASASGGGAVVGIAAADYSYGSSAGDFSPSANMLSVTQPLKENEFFIVATKGTGQEINRTLSQLGKSRTVPGTFGSLTSAASGIFPLFLVLEYWKIELEDSAALSGSGELIFRNAGLTPLGHPSIRLEKKR
jgi:hypothetical protein